MVAPTQWNGEFVADLAANGPVLRETQVMGVRGPSAADQTRLLSHKFNVVLVTAATRLRVCRHESSAMLDGCGRF